MSEEKIVEFVEILAKHMNKEDYDAGAALLPFLEREVAATLRKCLAEKRRPSKALIETSIILLLLHAGDRDEDTRQ